MYIIKGSNNFVILLDFGCILYLFKIVKEFWKINFGKTALFAQNMCEERETLFL